MSIKLRSLLTVLAVFLSVSAAQAMSSSPSRSDSGVENGMNVYQVRIMGGNFLNFQGITAYYDQNGTPQTRRIFGNTPYAFTIKSRAGVYLYFRVSNIQPTRNFGGIFRILLFQGDKFLKESRAFVNRGEVSLKYGNYPNMNLEFMVPPVGAW